MAYSGVQAACTAAGTPASGSARDGCELVTDANAYRVPMPPAPPVKTGLARAGSAQLWYQDTGGDGVPVVLLHPASGSAHCWGYQMSPFANAGYRVIAYSRRGYRGSDNGTSGDANDAVDDFLGFVDSLGIDRFHAVSVAGGGIVAGGFAARPAGKRLISLTLASTNLLLPEEHWGGFVVGGSMGGLATDMRELSPAYRMSNPAGHALWNDIHARSRGDDSQRKPGERRPFQPWGEVRSVADVNRISAPTLWIVGTADLYTPPPFVKYLSTLTPNSQLAVIDGVGHGAYWERPDVFNQIVLAFMGRA